MKKLLAILALFVLTASSVLATDLDITPDFTTMDADGDVQIVDVCVKKSGGAPDIGRDLEVETYCRDLNSNEVCDPGDETLPVKFSAVVTSSPTDDSGCGEITLTTLAGVATGVYAYKVNGVDGDVVVASEHGLVLVPEFTTLGAGLALVGAGYYMHRKRRKKK